MREIADLEDMLVALVEVHKKIANVQGEFADAPPDILETLLAVSTAEINLITWSMGMHEREGDFLTLAVCGECGGHGEWYTEDNETIECKRRAGHVFNEAEAN